MSSAADITQALGEGYRLITDIDGFIEEFQKKVQSGKGTCKASAAAFACTAGAIDVERLRNATFCVTGPDDLPRGVTVKSNEIACEILFRNVS